MSKFNVWDRVRAREIQYRLQCARAYPTDAQIARASAEFQTWSALISADFPAFEAAEGELPADHRTDAERKRDHARAIADIIGEQGALFPLDTFEPIVTTLKDMEAYADEQEELTQRFARAGARRRAYLNDLISAADGDLSMTWVEAHERLDDGTEIGDVAA